MAAVEEAVAVEAPGTVPPGLTGGGVATAGAETFKTRAEEAQGAPKGSLKGVAAHQCVSLRTRFLGRTSANHLQVLSSAGCLPPCCSLPLGHHAADPSRSEQAARTQRRFERVVSP